MRKYLLIVMAAALVFSTSIPCLAASNVSEYSETSAEASESRLEDTFESSGSLPTEMENPLSGGTQDAESRIEEAIEETQAPRIIEVVDESETEPVIEKIETPVIDDNGNTSIDVSVAENVSLPLTLTMKGAEQTLKFEIKYNGQVFKVAPGTYTVEQAIGGDGSKYETGASLTIPDEGGAVYLDFTKPKTIFDGQWKNLVIVNLVFAVIAIIAYRVFVWYKKSLT